MEVGGPCRPLSFASTPPASPCLASSRSDSQLDRVLAGARDGAAGVQRPGLSRWAGHPRLGSRAASGGGVTWAPRHSKSSRQAVCRHPGLAGSPPSLRVWMGEPPAEDHPPSPLQAHHWAGGWGSSSVHPPSPRDWGAHSGVGWACLSEGASSHWADPIPRPGRLGGPSHLGVSGQGDMGDTVEVLLQRQSRPPTGPPASLAPGLPEPVGLWGHLGVPDGPAGGLLQAVGWWGWEQPSQSHRWLQGRGRRVPSGLGWPPCTVLSPAVGSRP